MSEHTVNILLHKISWLGFIPEMESVHYAVTAYYKKKSPSWKAIS